MHRPEPERLIRSSQRVDAYGEVLTPSWVVEEMLDLVKTESERIDSRFLEPACGSGNFLASVLGRKLNAVHKQYSENLFEKEHYSLQALMRIYGIEILADNVGDCRNRMIATLAHFFIMEDIYLKSIF